MRFAVLAITTALLSAGTNLAAPDATTLVSGYKRLLTLTEEIRDDLARLTTANAFLVAPVRARGQSPARQPCQARCSQRSGG